jgi:hypothetical protein
MARPHQALCRAAPLAYAVRRANVRRGQAMGVVGARLRVSVKHTRGWLMAVLVAAGEQLRSPSGADENRPCLPPRP